MATYWLVKVEENVVKDNKAKCTVWSQRDDIKAELIIQLAIFKWPPVSSHEVNKDIFTQAENFKKNRAV
jgi:type I restriction enzyme R subunit